jgi:hypothetical protein
MEATSEIRELVSLPVAWVCLETMLKLFTGVPFENV